MDGAWMGSCFPPPPPPLFNKTTKDERKMRQNKRAAEVRLGPRAIARHERPVKMLMKRRESSGRPGAEDGRADVWQAGRRCITITNRQ